LTFSGIRVAQSLVFLAWLVDFFNGVRVAQSLVFLPWSKNLSTMTQKIKD
jgi:hypothetical protein